MPEPLWTAEEIGSATSGHVTAPFAATGVSIDTRTLEPGDLFVALAGERDGHAFVAQAMSKGAAGVLCALAVDAPAVRVADTFQALEQLGLAARIRAPQSRRAAVTGSVGKTSVTQAIAAALKLAGQSHSSVLSYNNHIGVPLTLARMPRKTERAVFEIGMNHADEIRPLVKMVRPHVAVVTLVGSAHVENFEDGEAGVARAKAEIFEGLEPGGVAVLNADNRWFGGLRAAASDNGARILSFGRGEDCDARLIDMTADGAGAKIVVALHGQTVSFPIAHSGAHWGLNSLAAILAVEALGAPVELALEALASFAPLKGRGETRALTVGGAVITLIDESYNANPISMRSALAALPAHKVAVRDGGGRKIAVLTDMLELGEGAPAVHADLAAPLAAAGIDRVFLAGPSMHALWEALPESRRGAWRNTAEALAPALLDALESGDVVMIKGSKGSKAAHLVEVLLAADQKDRARAGEGC
jgi:UDP-N-acetylmuramoyl-tripeptide--D-alanyl-D-alanine ligase